jgi:hypothetical protein
MIGSVAVAGGCGSSGTQVEVTQQQKKQATARQNATREYMKKQMQGKMRAHSRAGP